MKKNNKNPKHKQKKRKMTELLDLLKIALQRYDLQLVSYLLDIASHPVFDENIRFEEDYLSFLLSKNNNQLTDLTLKYWTSQNNVEIFQSIVSNQNKYALQLFLNKFHTEMNTFYKSIYASNSRYYYQTFYEHYLLTLIVNPYYNFALGISDVRLLLNIMTPNTTWKETLYKWNANTILHIETRRIEKIERLENHLDKILYGFKIFLYDRNVTRIIADYATLFT